MHNSFDLISLRTPTCKLIFVCWTISCLIFSICECNSQAHEQLHAEAYSGSASVDGSKISNIVPTRLTKDPEYESESETDWYNNRPRAKDQDDTTHNLNEHAKEEPPKSTSGRKETRKQELERKRKEKKEEKKNMIDWAKWIIPIGVLVLLGVVFAKEAISRYRRSH